MKNFSNKKNIILFLAVLISFLTIKVAKATPPTTLYHDPAIFHDIYGHIPYINHDKTEGKKRQFCSLDLEPFYEHASGAKNSNGHKVPCGDINGRWNMIGLLQGQEASPNGTLNDGSHTYMLDAYNNIEHGRVSSTNYLSNTFTDTNGTFGYFSIPINHEKFGLRTKFQLKFNSIALTVRTGVINYKQNPTFNDMTPSATDYGFNPYDIVLTDTYLMIEQRRTHIFNEIGLDVNKVNKTTMEDTHIELSWNKSFGMDNEDGVLTVAFQPFLAAGIWLPSGVKKNQDAAMSIPTGNNGFIGYTIEGALNFDFPGTIMISVGGSATFFGHKTVNNYRLPSNDGQSGIYPWKTTVRLGQGTVWRFQTGFISRHFLENLSMGFGYIFTKKEQDSILIKDTSTRTAYFKTGKAEKESGWESQMFHFGADYDITRELALGAAIETPITGKRILRTLTLMGDVRFSF